MKPCDYVIAALEHQETDHLAFTFGFDQKEYEKKMDDYYGVADWRDKLTPYIVQVKGASAEKRHPAKAGRDLDSGDYEEDIFGSVWRLNGYEPHLEKPTLSRPSFDGFTFPRLEDYGYDFEEIKKDAFAAREEFPDFFLIASCGAILFVLSWAL